MTFTRNGGAIVFLYAKSGEKLLSRKDRVWVAVKSNQDIVAKQLLFVPKVFRFLVPVDEEELVIYAKYVLLLS